MTAVPDRLDIRMDGWAMPAGTLARDGGKAVSFTYAPDYLSAGGPPLSFSLPLTEKPYADALSRAFFDNLLPENDTVLAVIEREGLDRDDLVGIFAHLGADCSGAISCLVEGSPPVKVPGDLTSDYRPLEESEAAAIVRSLAEKRRLPEPQDDPSPVAGVQSKIAIAVLADGRLALPASAMRVPTTHILKVPAANARRETDLEAAAASLARSAGLDVADADPIEVGGYAALLVRRFDRVVIDGRVTRLHQEDFAQAMGLPARLKYERRGLEGRRYDLPSIIAILDRTAMPAKARESFILATLLNLAIGNNDNHAKNHALLYDRGAVPRLAPLYDLLPTLMNDRLTPELAFKVGEATTAADVTTEDLKVFFGAFGLSGSRMQRFIERQVRALATALDKAGEGLHARGLKDFDDLMGRELTRLTSSLGLKLDLRVRDFYASRGGGWSLS